jgi:hypothetical protein
MPRFDKTFVYACLISAERAATLQQQDLVIILIAFREPY